MITEIKSRHRLQPPRALGPAPRFSRVGRRLSLSADPFCRKSRLSQIYDSEQLLRRSIGDFKLQVHHDTEATRVIGMPSGTEKIRDEGTKLGEACGITPTTCA